MHPPPCARAGYCGSPPLHITCRLRIPCHSDPIVSISQHSIFISMVKIAGGAGVAGSAGVVVGMNKGHIVEKRKLPARPVQRRRQSKRVKHVREVIRDVAGLAPYERRCIEALKTGMVTDKKLYKIAKNRLGTHSRAIKKRSELKDLYAAMRAKAM